MEGALLEGLKIYGPLALGWVIAAYLGKFILDRYQADIDARIKLAQAIDNLSRMIADNHGEPDAQSHSRTLR